MRVGIGDKLGRRPRPQPHFAVDHAQPIGRGCARQKIRLAGEPPAVGEVIHAFMLTLVPAPRSSISPSGRVQGSGFRVQDGYSRTGKA